MEKESAGLEVDTLLCKVSKFRAGWHKLSRATIAPDELWAGTRSADRSCMHRGYSPHPSSSAQHNSASCGGLWISLPNLSTCTCSSLIVYYTETKQVGSTLTIPCCCKNLESRPVQTLATPPHKLWIPTIHDPDVCMCINWITCELVVSLSLSLSLSSGRWQQLHGRPVGQPFRAPTRASTGQSAHNVPTTNT